MHTWIQNHQKKPHHRSTMSFYCRSKRSHRVDKIDKFIMYSALVNLRWQICKGLRRITTWSIFFVVLSKKLLQYLIILKKACITVTIKETILQRLQNIVNAVNSHVNLQIQSKIPQRLWKLLSAVMSLVESTRKQRNAKHLDKGLCAEILEARQTHMIQHKLACHC